MIIHLLISFSISSFHNRIVFACLHLSQDNVTSYISGIKPRIIPRIIPCIIIPGIPMKNSGCTQYGTTLWILALCVLHPQLVHLIAIQQKKSRFINIKKCGQILFIRFRGLGQPNNKIKENVRTEYSAKHHL